jgi:hypothetical protein
MKWQRETFGIYRPQVENLAVDETVSLLRVVGMDNRFKRL